MHQIHKTDLQLFPPNTKFQAFLYSETKKIKNTKIYFWTSEIQIVVFQKGNSLVQKLDS